MTHRLSLNRFVAYITLCKISNSQMLEFRVALAIMSKVIDLFSRGGGWGTGVPPGLQNRVCPVDLDRWVRFPRTPAKMNACT